MSKGYNKRGVACEGVVPIADLLPLQAQGGEEEGEGCNDCPVLSRPREHS